ncbi:hypothetical protein CKF54_00220 [Psittacicella hinzii]|uniref:Uncharacterized protein n=1 Tax=Psittacicella hinzii TaxID=2028575 RepID=A0A3A1Y9U9_9GAMM|nr:hypothetical protein [Psittacicella hinzii]RIY34455.1 hypothetical protein CKF54_00220 [Psittacicella hinzii]
MVRKDYETFVRKDLKRLIDNVKEEVEKGNTNPLVTQPQGSYRITPQLFRTNHMSYLSSKSNIFDKNIEELKVETDEDGIQVKDINDSEVITEAYVRLHANYLAPTAHSPHPELLKFLEKHFALSSKLITEQLETHKNELLVQNTVLPALFKNIANLQEEVRALEEKIHGYVPEDEFALYNKLPLAGKLIAKDNLTAFAVHEELLSKVKESYRAQVISSLKDLALVQTNYRDVLLNDNFSSGFKTPFSYFYTNFHKKGLIKRYLHDHGVVQHPLDKSAFLFSNLLQTDEIANVNANAIKEVKDLYNNLVVEQENDFIVRYDQPTLFQLGISTLSSSFAWHPTYPLSDWNQIAPLLEVFNLWLTEASVRSMTAKSLTMLKLQYNYFLANVYAVLDANYNEAYNYITNYNQQNIGDLLFGRELAYQIGVPNPGDNSTLLSTFIQMPGIDVSRFNIFLKANLNFDFGYSFEEGKYLTDIFTLQNSAIVQREIKDLARQPSNYSASHYQLSTDFAFVYKNNRAGLISNLYDYNYRASGFDYPSLKEIDIEDTAKEHSQAYTNLYVYKRLGFNPFGAINWFNKNPLELNNISPEELLSLYTSQAAGFREYTHKRNADIFKTYGFETTKFFKEIGNIKPKVENFFAKDRKNNFYTLTVSDMLVGLANKNDTLFKIESDLELEGLPNKGVSEIFFNRALASRPKSLDTLKVKLKQNSNEIYQAQSPEYFNFKLRENAILSSRFLASQAGNFLPTSLAQATGLPYDKFYESLRKIVKRAILVRQNFTRLPRALSYKFNEELLDFSKNHLNSKEKLGSLNIALNAKGHALERWLVNSEDRLSVNFDKLHHLQMRVEFFNASPRKVEANNYYLVKDNFSDRFSIIYLQEAQEEVRLSNTEQVAINYLAHSTFDLNHAYDEDSYTAVDLENKYSQVVGYNEILAGKFGLQFLELTPEHQDKVLNLFSFVPGLYETLVKYGDNSAEVIPSKFSYGLDLNWYVEPMSYSFTQDLNSSIVKPIAGLGYCLRKNHATGQYELASPVHHNDRLVGDCEITWDLFDPAVSSKLADVEYSENQYLIGFKDLADFFASYQVIGSIKQIAVIPASIEEMILDTKSDDNLLFERYDLTRMGRHALKSHLASKGLISHYYEKEQFNLRNLVLLADKVKLEPDNFSSLNEQKAIAPLYSKIKLLDIEKASTQTNEELFQSLTHTRDESGLSDFVIDPEQMADLARLIGPDLLLSSEDGEDDFIFYDSDPYFYDNDED